MTHRTPNQRERRNNAPIPDVLSMIEIRKRWIANGLYKSKGAEIAESLGIPVDDECTCSPNDVMACPACLRRINRNIIPF